MGMSTKIKAFRSENDQEFIKHKKVLLACKEAGVSLPKETAEYFGEAQAHSYLLDENLEVELKLGVHYKEYDEDMMQGFDVEIDALPSNVKKIRFVNSW